MKVLKGLLSVIYICFFYLFYGYIIDLKSGAISILGFIIFTISTESITECFNGIKILLDRKKGTQFSKVQCDNIIRYYKKSSVCMFLITLIMAISSYLDIYYQRLSNYNAEKSSIILSVNVIEPFIFFALYIGFIVMPIVFKSEYLKTQNT